MDSVSSGSTRTPFSHSSTISRGPPSRVAIIGNPLAARHRLRRLDEQPDFNRCWPGGTEPDSAYTRLFRRIHDRLLELRPLACVDIHNNTGLNPHYAAVNRIRSDYLRLASLFSTKVTYFTIPMGTLSHSMSEFCPALTLECGQAGEVHGTDHSMAFLEACLHLEQISLQPVDADAVHLFHMVATVNVDPDVLFGFGRVPADVAFREDECRVRETRARENLAVLRHIAMTRLKQDSAKLGIKTKRLKAGWSESYLAKLLFQPPTPDKEKATSGNPNIREA